MRRRSSLKNKAGAARRSISHSNDELSQESVPTEPEEERGQALEAALNFLSYRPRSCQEVRRKLASRGYDEGIIETAVERLTAVGLLDDEAFIGNYVRDRIAHRPMGVRRMANDLYLKGISRDVAVPVIKHVLRHDGVDERALAMRAAEKRHQALERGGAVDSTMRRRLGEHLARRGFGPGLINDIVGELIAPS